MKESFEDRRVAQPGSLVAARLPMRVWRAPLWAHAVLLAVVVCGFVVLSRPGSMMMSDEGAVAAQARQLAAGQGWLYRYPLAGLDPEGGARPFVRGDVGTSGVAPYAKHPAYPLAVMATGGTIAGALVLSAVGTTLAALAAALVAARLCADPSAPRAALWVVGFASPLLVDSGLVLAHTLAAATAGAAVAAALLIIERRPTGARLGVGLLAVAIAIALTVSWRTEGAIVAVALAVVSLGVGFWQRRWDVAALAAAAGAGGALATLGNRLARHHIVGTSLPTPPNQLTPGLAGRWDAFFNTWVRPAYGPLTGSGLVLVAGAACVAGAVVLVRVGHRRAGLGTGGVGVALYATSLLVGPTGPVPGLLVAAPAVVALLMGSNRLMVVGPARVFVVATSALSSVAILATEYSIGGGYEWGGRYFAVVLPIALPALVVGALGALPKWLPRVSDRRALVGLIGLSCLLAASIGLQSLRQGHQASAALGRSLTSVRSDAAPGAGWSRPIVVSSNRLLPQLLEPEFLDFDWIVPSGPLIPRYMDRLAAAGVQRVVLVVPDSSDVVTALGSEGWKVVEQGPPAPYDVVVLGHGSKR